METSLLFDRPVHTIKAISLTTGISRTTILKACQKGLLGACAYRSGDAWLIDTACPQFEAWLAAHPTQRRVKGRLAREQQSQEGGGHAQAAHIPLVCEEVPHRRAQPEDILAVQLPDGSEALVQVCGPAAIIGGYSEHSVRVDVLKPTGPYGVLWYRASWDDHCTAYEYTLPAISDPTHGHVSERP